MGEIRERRTRLHALRANEREAQDVPQRLQSAGDTLIKQLVSKQTCTQTSLAEQLAVRKNFLGEGSSHAASGCGELSVEELQRKTGLSRDEIESSLSVKPDSAISKLYKFALSNQSGLEKQSDLIANLPNHPINHLKSLEQDLMKSVEKSTAGGRRKRRKHRIRKKKKVIEATVAERPRRSRSLWDVRELPPTENNNSDKRA